MIKKRFHSEDNCVGYYTEIIDELKELDLTLPNPQKNLTIEEAVALLNEQHEEIERLKEELNAFKPVMFQDMRKGTILLYAKRYGDVE